MNRNVFGQISNFVKFQRHVFEICEKYEKLNKCKLAENVQKIEMLFCCNMY